MSTRLRSGFAKDDSGSIAVIFGLLMVVLAGAAGLAVDTIQNQNARRSLTQIVALTCERAANANEALYKSPYERVQMARAFAGTQVSQSKLDETRTTFEINADATAISIVGRTEIQRSIMQIMGFGASKSEVTQRCAYRKAATEDEFNCPDGTLVTGFLDRKIAPPKPNTNYIADLVDEDNKSKARKLFGASRGERTAFFEEAKPGDSIIIQPLSPKGEIPGVCRSFKKLKPEQKIVRRTDIIPPDLLRLHGNDFAQAMKAHLANGGTLPGVK